MPDKSTPQISINSTGILKCGIATPIEVTRQFSVGRDSLGVESNVEELCRQNQRSNTYFFFILMISVRGQNRRSEFSRVRFSAAEKKALRTHVSVAPNTVPVQTGNLICSTYHYETIIFGQHVRDILRGVFNVIMY